MYINVDSEDDKLWYSRSRSTFYEPSFREGVTVKEIFEKDHNTIQECIDLFNSEINWVGMFDLDTAISRLKNNHRMFALFDSTLLGYCWVDDDYIYNFFVCKKRVKGDSQDFCNYICNLINKDVRLFVVKPNVRGQKFFEKVGFTRI